MSVVKHNILEDIALIKISNPPVNAISAAVRIELLETIADRVIVMDAGEIIAEGDLKDVIDNPKVKEAYFEG